MLVFALMAAGGGALSAKLLTGCAYGFFVLMGAIEMIWGLPELKREVEWARTHVIGEREPHNARAERPR